MSGRTAKLLRQTAKYNKLDYKQVKKWYRVLPQSKRSDLRKLNGMLITLTKDYIEQLRMGIYPTQTLK